MNNSSCNTPYYVVDGMSCLVYIFNDNWSYVSTGLYVTENIAYMITVGNSLYLSGGSSTGSNLWKSSIGWVWSGIEQLK